MFSERIIDEFTEQEVSNQVKYLRRKRARGHCSWSGCNEVLTPKANGSLPYYCAPHALWHSTYNKTKFPYKRKEKKDVRKTD